MHNHRDTQTHTHTWPLPLPLSVFVLPLADFVFAGNRWADIDSLVDNKYTLLSLALSFSDISLSVHLNVLTYSLCCNPLCVEMIHPLFFSVVYQTKIPNIHQIQPFRCEDLLCLMQLYIKYLWGLECW